MTTANKIIESINIDILTIRALCISSRAFKKNGKIDKQLDKLSEARHEVYILGYNSHDSVMIDDDSMPKGLEFFIELNKYWTDGRNYGYSCIEISDCSVCQDNDVGACYIHDMP